MNEQEQLDFLSAFGEEFCEALVPLVGWDRIVPQDGFEVFVRTFDCEPTPYLLSCLSDRQMEDFRVGCEQLFECEGVTIEMVRRLVARTLGRWPADGCP